MRLSPQSSKCCKERRKLLHQEACTFFTYGRRKLGWQDSRPVGAVAEWQVACHRGWGSHLELAQACPRVPALEIEMSLRGWGRFTSKRMESRCLESLDFAV